MVCYNWSVPRGRPILHFPLSCCMDQLAHSAFHLMGLWPRTRRCHFPVHSGRISPRGLPWQPPPSLWCPRFSVDTTSLAAAARSLFGLKDRAQRAWQPARGEAARWGRLWRGAAGRASPFPPSHACAGPRCPCPPEPTSTGSQPGHKPSDGRPELGPGFDFLFNGATNKTNAHLRTLR